jgi:hypothetical protein
MLDHHIAVLGEASPDLVNAASGPPVTVRIDTDALNKAESGVGNAAAEQVRELVATVGKPGQPGAQVRCLVSVAMLSEGWDARNVTQILGLRAFQSQLLCEQVVAGVSAGATTPTSPSLSTSTSTECHSSSCPWPATTAPPVKACGCREGHPQL